MKFYLFAKIQVCNFEMFTYKLKKVKELYVVLTLMVKNLPISTIHSLIRKQNNQLLRLLGRLSTPCLNWN